MVSSRNVNAGREGNEGPKLRQLRSYFSITATAAVEIGGFGFVSMRRAQKWSHLLKLMKKEREAKERRSSIPAILTFPRYLANFVELYLIIEGEL